MTSLAAFTFLRPLALLALPVLAGLWLLLRRRARAEAAPTAPIAPHLLAALTIGGEGRRIGLEILEIEFLNPLFVLFQHDEGLVAAVEGMGDQATRLATAADQVKRFFQQANAPVEAIGRQRVLKTLVLQQRDQCHHRV